MPWWRVSYAVVFAALVAMLLASAAGRSPPPSPMPVTQSFAQRWDGVPRVIPLPSRPVQTIPIAPDAPLPPMPAIAELPPAPEAVQQTVPQRTQAKALTTDICRGKGRIYIRNGKSWRCRR